jgi:hypothetical protein
MSISSSNFDGLGPHVSDRYLVSAIAGEALTMGQLVEITADWTVKASTLTTTPSTKILGVAVNTVASGKAVTVLCRALARLTAYGTITAGDRVGSGPNGTVQTVADPSASDCNTSAGTAAAIISAFARIGKCFVGASSGGTAYVLLT